MTDPLELKPGCPPKVSVHRDDLSTTLFPSFFARSYTWGLHSVSKDLTSRSDALSAGAFIAHTCTEASERCKECAPIKYQRLRESSRHAVPSRGLPSGRILYPMITAFFHLCAGYYWKGRFLAGTSLRSQGCFRPQPNRPGFLISRKYCGVEGARAFLWLVFLSGYDYRQNSKGGNTERLPLLLVMVLVIPSLVSASKPRDG